MKSRRIAFVLLMMLPALLLSGQDEKRRILNVEAGIEFISAEPQGKDYIREGVDQNYYEFSATGLRGLLYKNYLGVKYETRILKNKIGILSGLKYTRMAASLGKENYWSGSPDFFYLLFSREGTKTEYMKVKEIEQITGYMGIPLELRIYPYIKERRTNIYVYYKIGSDFNFRIHSRTSALFSNEAMDQYEGAIGGIVEKPWSFYSSFHLGVGFRIGKKEKPGVNIELLYPAFILGRESQGIVNPESGGGVQVNFRLPF